jgi:6-phosphogluconate dehydrogenase
MSPSSNPVAQIGVTGLAVMGSNIARNFARHGYTVALHNRSIAKTDALLAEHGSDGNFVRSETIAEFLAALERPRRVLIMVKAGEATDAVINELADAMEPGDIIIDGGNALYTDTIDASGELPAFKVGPQRGTRISLRALDAFIADRTFNVSHVDTCGHTEKQTNTPQL